MQKTNKNQLGPLYRDSDEDETSNDVPEDQDETSDADTVGDLASADPAIVNGGPYQPSRKDALAKVAFPTTDQIPMRQSQAMSVGPLQNELQQDQTKPISPQSVSPQSVQQTQPQAAPDFKSMMVSPDELQALSQAKQRNALMGAISDNLSNRQSVGNFMLGHMNPKLSSEGMVNALDNSAETPIQQKKLMLKQYQQLPQFQMQQNMQDPTSTLSKLTKASAMTAVQKLMQDPTNKDDPNAQSAFQSMKDLISDPKTTAYDVQNAIEKNPLIKDAFSASIAGQKLAATMAMGNARLGSQQDRIGMQSGKEYEKELEPTENVILGANRLQTLISKIQNTPENSPDRLKMTRALGSDVSAALATMFTNGKPPTVHGMEGQEQKSFYGSMQALKDQALGTSSDTMTNAQLDQLGKDLGFMRNEYTTQHGVKFNSFLQTMPEHLRDSLKARRNMFFDGLQQANEQSGDSDTVRVISPDGQTGTVPKSKLQDALKRGFKQVQ